MCAHTQYVYSCIVLYISGVCTSELTVCCADVGSSVVVLDDLSCMGEILVAAKNNCILSYNSYMMSIYQHSFHRYVKSQLYKRPQKCMPWAPPRQTRDLS